MTKIDIVSGFLGAGKTTFINKVIAEGLGGSVAVIENEIGDEAIDDYLVESSGLEVRTLASGCICCSLKIGFADTVRALVEEHAPAHIVIEPTGIAGPDDVVAACELAARDAAVEVASIITVVNAANLERMLRLRALPFMRQLEQARVVVLSHVGELGEDELASVGELLSREVAPGVPVIVRDWSTLDALEVLAVAEEAYAGEGGRGAAGDSAGAHREGREHEHDHGQGGHRGHSHGFAGLDVVTLSPRSRLARDGAARLDELVADESHGRVLRAKGFVLDGDGVPAHYEYVYGSSTLEPTAYAGPPKLVIIGEHLDRAFFARQLG